MKKFETLSDYLDSSVCEIATALNCSHDHAIIIISNYFKFELDQLRCDYLNESEMAWCSLYVECEPLETRLYDNLKELSKSKKSSK